MGRRGCGEAAGGLKPAAAMSAAQFVFAGLQIFYKLALNDGMDVRVLIAYRYLFAVSFLCPLAFFLERKRRPRLTWKVVLGTFLCGLFGGTLGQNLYVFGMKLTSATFVSAISNLTPAITFVLAVSCRLERLDMRQRAGQAKLLGTVVALGGAMLLTFYKGVEFRLWPPAHASLLRARAGPGSHRSRPPPGGRVLGSFLAIASCFCYAIWLIVQAKLGEVYPCHYSSAALVCLMGGVQATVLAACTRRDKEDWKIGFDIRLLSAAYAGIISSGSVFPLVAWCIQKKGPLFASVFSPLMLLIVAILSAILLDESLHLVSVLGAILIVSGLYLVLWGKGREDAGVPQEVDKEIVTVTTNAPTAAVEQDENN